MAANNLEAIKAWVRSCRPDLVHMLPQMERENAFILLLTIGFEAGRSWQKQSPDDPSLPPVATINIQESPTRW